MTHITPFLWFDDQAEEAAKFYTGIFKNSKITKTTHYPAAAEAVSGKKAGSVMTVAFELDGREFVALNGGPHFTFSPAVSFVVPCETQAEVDALWAKLTEGGSEGQCGWLTDKFGVSWQVVPAELSALMEDPDKADKVMAAMMPMKKLDITILKQAA